MEPRRILASLASLLLACGGGTTIVNTMPADDLSVVKAPPDLVHAPPGDMAVDNGPCGKCLADTPKCDAASRMCVACLADGDCPIGSVCHAHSCQPGCAENHGCGDAGVCDVDAGVCRDCLVDADCRDQTRPVCDAQSARCVACSPLSDKCPDGQWCTIMGGEPKCAAGCKATIDCQGIFGASGACCNHTCVDTAKSKDNCGGCGMGCGGMGCCAGKCIDLMGDVNNCGACGMACGGNHVVVGCNAGKCTAMGCAMGFADCDMNAGNGCEVSLMSDAANCGSCNTVCSVPNASALCVGGACALGGCNMGFRNCNGNDQDGCEINVAIDNANCGSCGQPCGKVTHGSASCAAGKCAVMTCDAGFLDCDMIGNNGCEVDKTSDLLHCGACANRCPTPPHVIVSCTNGMCNMGGCVQGFVDCDKDPQTGCEAQLAVDLNNCGACGVVCKGMGQNATAACMNGGCTLTCLPNFADCDGSAQNGCEVDLRVSTSNCGACGNVCPNNMPVCLGGKCGNVFKSCKDLAGGGQQSGIFMIDPDGQGGNAPFNAYCDLTTAGGGWTLIAWTAMSGNQPLGVPYPGLAPCPQLDCARGSGVPQSALASLFATAAEFGMGQSINANQKNTYSDFGTYQYAGRYNYTSLAGLMPQYANTICSPMGGFTGTFANVVGAAMYDNTPVFVAQYLSYASYNYSSDANMYIWNIGVPGMVCGGTGAPPGTWMGTWNRGQYGPGGANMPGSYSVWVR